MFRTVVLAIMVLAATTPRAASVAFTSHYDGRGAEGIDDIWRGTLDRPGAGVITIRVETQPDGSARGFVFMSSDTLERSFGATVTGRIDGEKVHLTGPVDVGRASGATIDLRMRVARHSHSIVAGGFELTS